MLLVVLIFLTLVVVVIVLILGLGLFRRDPFLFYSALVGAGLFLVVYTLSHALSRLVIEGRLSVRLISWTLLAPLCFSSTLFILVYVFRPIEQQSIPAGTSQTVWSLTVPRDAFWAWFGIFPLNVIMLAIWLVGVLAGVMQEEPSMLGYALARAERKRVLTLYVKSERKR